jgi:peptidyl-prolyl cis-trans isomerase D
MMHKMRENTKIILWVVVVAFVVTIFAVWGLDLRTGKDAADPNLIGRVNGAPITRFQYQASYEALSRQIRAGSKETLTFAQEDFIANQAWENVVNTVLTDQQIEKLDITVNNDEIVSYLRNSPPPEIQQYFLDDKGNFDNNAYQAALNNPEIDWTNLEQLARERIPRLKLQNYLAAQVFVSDEEVRQAYDMQNIEMQIEYVEYPIDDVELGDFSPGEEEIDAYYKSHSDEFVDPAKARIDILRFDIKPSAADIEDAAFTANRVHEQILAGEDFGAMANTYSESATSNVEGNTGFIRRGQREAAYFDALDKLAPGEVGDPVACEDGYYVLKLIETKTEEGQKEYNAQEILVKSATGRETIDSLYSVVTEVRDRAKEVGLDAAAVEKGFPLLTPEPFTEGAPIGTVGFVPALNRFAFANEVGTLSSIVRDDKHVYLARVVDRIPESLRPLDQVTESIRHRLVFEEKKKTAERDATAFYRKAVAADFANALQTYGKTAKTTETFKAADNLENFGARSTVAQAALRTDKGRIAPPVLSRRSFVVFTVTEKTAFDPADFGIKNEDLRGQLEVQKIQAYSIFWFDKIRKESLIEDYRDRVS